MELSEQVKDDIEQFININISYFQADAKEYDGLDITFATTDGNSWNYQIGDNSFTGGAYGLQHWAVYTIMPDTTPEELFNDIIEQLEELLRGY